MKEITNNQLAELIVGIRNDLTDTRGELHEFIGFVKDNMATHADLQDLRTDLAATEYRIMDRMDRGFAKRDYEIGNIKTTIKQFHPTAFPEPKTAP